MQNLQPPVARLGIKGYEFWSGESCAVNKVLASLCAG